MTINPKGLLGASCEIYQYTLDHSLREDPVLKKLREVTAENPKHFMQISPDQGQFMALLAKITGARRTIEVGVFTGYSALAVAMAMPEDSYTLACDINEQWTATAQEFWALAGVDHKIDLKLAPAVETLQNAINNGESGGYDMAFIDADKPGYDQYYELCLTLLRSGGLLLIDNVLLSGAVVGGHQQDKHDEASVKAVMALNDKILHDQRIDLSMLTIADGLSLIRKH